VKCGSTKFAEGNAAKGLKCDDECARLERNRKLALALNIDQDTHTDDHVPYQAETLNMYLKAPAWAQVQEKQLRLFAADPEEKRLRFKPMKNHERAFIHALSDDFGFDSESMDPEPHRHVAIFKTPRFVMAPMKTLVECARIRQIQRSIATGVSVITTEPKAKAKASNLVGDPLNALLLTHARFGLTVEEMRAAINPSLSTSGTGLQFDISFLPSEEIVLVPLQQQASSERALETTLSNLKPAFVKALSTPNFLGRLELCRVDDSLNIERRESDSASSGWSQVAAKAAAPRRDVTRDSLFSGPRNKNNFAVFATAASKKKAVSEDSGKAESSKMKKVQRQESVDEDWMEAEEREEEKERLISGGNTAKNSGDEGDGADIAV
jgi:transcriptional repressor NF-X1